MPSNKDEPSANVTDWISKNLNLISWLVRTESLHAVIDTKKNTSQRFINVDYAIKFSGQKKSKLVYHKPWGIRHETNSGVAFKRLVKWNPIRRRENRLNEPRAKTTYTSTRFEALQRRRQSLNDLQETQNVIVEYGCVHKAQQRSDTNIECPIVRFKWASNWI